MAANLVYNTRISNGVFVKSLGWFVFGGDGNTFTKSQKLLSISGGWGLDQNLYLSVSDYGHCYFQVQIIFAL
jgi:hypothetical protein